MIVRLMIVRLMIVALRLMLVRILRELSYDCAFCMCGSILAGLAVVSGCGYSSGDGSADPIFACDLRRHRAGDLVVGGGGDGGLVVCVDVARGFWHSFNMVAASMTTVLAARFGYSVSMRLQSYVVEEAYFLSCVS